MAHKHSIYDSDPHFSINPSTRAIENESGKINITQYDHNSERFTFEIPRLVDGHDMSKCDLVEIHYDNTDGKNVSSDVYEAPDVQLSPNNPDVVIFSWLISGNATLYKGQLNFSISFQCTAADGTVEYEWGTAPYEGIKVGPRIRNTEAAMQGTTDILAKWKTDLFGIGDTEEANMRAVSQQEQDNIVAKGVEVLATIPADYTVTSERAEEAIRTKAEGIILSAEGESISVNDSANDYIRGLKLFGKTVQVTTTGKNLCSVNELTFTQMENVELSTPIPAGTYYVSLSAISNDTDETDCVINFYSGDTYVNGIRFSRNSRIEQQVGFTQDITNLYCYASMSYLASENDEATFSEIMITVDEKADYEPYTGGKPSPSPEWPQEIVSVEKPEVCVCGKNLLDITKAELIVVGSSGSKRYGIVFDNLGTYTFSCKTTDGIAVKVVTDGAYGEYVTLLGDVSHTFTLAENQYLIIYQGSDGKLFDTGLEDAQIEQGNIATAYEPYKTHNLNIPHTLPGIPVESGGNYTDENGQQWICDEIDFERGVYVQRCNRNIFDGSDDEVWSYDAEKALFKLAYLNANSGWNVVENLGKSFMLHYNYDGSIWNTHGTDYAYCINFNSLFIRHKGLTSLESFKEYAANNPIELVCILPTPIETPLPADEIAAFRELKTNYPNTTILNDAGTWMSVKYNADTKTYVDTPKILKMVDSSTGVVYELKIVDGNLTVVPI